MNDDKQQWADRVGKLLSGNITSEEERELLAWVESSEENRAYFEEMKAVWQITHPVHLDTAIDLDSEWQKIRRNVQPGNAPGAKLRVMYRLVAAAAAIALLIFVIHSKNRGTGSLSDQPVLVSADSTTLNKRIRLPDGSIALLRQGSTVSYQPDFETRRLTLTGEAYFEVVKDKDRPFSVEVGNAIVQVLGTKFNLREVADGDVELFVDEGRVAFSSLVETTREPLVVSGNEIAAYRRDTRSVVPLETLPNENIFSWRTRTLRFDSTPISVVFRDLQRHFGNDFAIEDSTLLRCTLSADFDNAEIEEVVDVIEFSLGWQLTRENDVFTVTGPPCENPEQK